MRRNAKHIFIVEQHTLSSIFHIGDSVATWSDVLSQIRTWALVILEMPVDMPFGQTVSGRQRCSDSVSQACQLPSSSEGIVFSADPASITIYWNSSEEYWNVLPDTIVYDYQSKNREQLPYFSSTSIVDDSVVVWSHILRQIERRTPMIPEMLIDLVHRLMIYWNSSEEYWNVLPDTIVYDYQSKNREQLP
ncbi:hypothetical protein T08_13380 [Trichinella sp. T8]|nr:hypothetical protein T08_13380 [Trichinella sp. T8]